MSASGGTLGQVGASSAEDNVRRWRTGDYVTTYANRTLRPVEVVILARYRDALSGRVLEIGCGAGRVLGYVLALGAETHGIDVSPRMVEYCHARYPDADVQVGDMTDLSATVSGLFDGIFASFNVLDVLDNPARREVLADIRDRLSPSGLLIFSSHNLAYADAGAQGTAGRRLLSKLDRPLPELIGFPRRLPARRRNRQRLAPLQRREADHAIINDEALDYSLLHYYIGRDDQARQLDQLGYELIECLDLDGQTVGAGEATLSPELHYVARRRGYAENDLSRVGETTR